MPLMQRSAMAIPVRCCGAFSRRWLPSMSRSNRILRAPQRRWRKPRWKETGSSLGTLVGTCLLTIAKEARARGGGLDAADMADVTAAMADAVATRGKASVGDKTVLDSLTAISEALGAGPATQASAAAAARAILTDLRGKPCRAGRARMYPERSVGADDPGMLAAALLLDEVETADAD